MESVTLGYAKRPELTEGNVERNQALEVKKGDTLKIYKYNEATVNGIHAYDSIETCKVLAIRKGKDGRRVKIQNLDLNYECTLLIDKSQCKIEIIKEVPAVKEIEVIETIEPKTVSPVEELRQESQEVINSISTETLENKKESLKAVSIQLDKINEAIEKNLNNEEIRLQLRDIENNLKYNYSGLYEMIEEQTVPNANDFNNIETLKDVYITNWNELPQEIQDYILSCDKYWIDLQEILIYKDNKIVASIGISGHNKHDIEINSIGAGHNGELFQWNTTNGYTTNNLIIEDPKQDIVIDKLENLINNSFDLNKTIASEEQRASIRLYFKRLLATNKYTQCILSVYKDSDMRIDFTNTFTNPLNLKLHEDREKVLNSIRHAINQYNIVKIKLV